MDCRGIVVVNFEPGNHGGGASVGGGCDVMLFGGGCVCFWPGPVWCTCSPTEPDSSTILTN
eukprot:scaffold63700_cov20-Cyclotella_meneghiniana.AAC.2